MHWTHGHDWIGELLNSCHGLTSSLHDAALLSQSKLYMGYAGGAKEWKKSGILGPRSNIIGLRDAGAYWEAGEGMDHS